MKQVIHYAIILFLIGILLHQCEENLHNKNLALENGAALTDSVRYYTNKLGSQTATIKTLQLNNRQFESVIIKKDKELSKLGQQFTSVKSVIRVESKLSIDTIAVKFSESINASDTAANFERTGTVTNKWYNIGYKVTNDSLKLSQFSTWTKTTVITGTKRKWFLGKETLVTDITYDNPYIAVTSADAAEVILPRPWYQKWYVWLAAGIIGGLVIQ